MYLKTPDIACIITIKICDSADINSIKTFLIVW